MVERVEEFAAELNGLPLTDAEQLCDGEIRISFVIVSPWKSVVELRGRFCGHDSGRRVRPLTVAGKKLLQLVSSSDQKSSSLSSPGPLKSRFLARCSVSSRSIGPIPGRLYEGNIGTKRFYREVAIHK